MGNVKITSIPYNDGLHKLLNDYRSLIIPIINKSFGTLFWAEKIVFSPSEHFLNRQNGNENERITNTILNIWKGNQ